MATMSAVAEIIDERAQGHGWWYHLKPGWKRRGYETHAIRADNKSELNKMLRDEVVACECGDCQEQPQ